MLEAGVQICGYSYHYEHFYTGYRNGLTSYLFRLQTEGSAEVHFRGEIRRLEAGDLLLLRPGDDYELYVEGVKEDETKISSGDYYLFCEGPWIEAWWSRRARPAVSRIGQDEKLLGLWRQLILEKRRRPEEEDPELTGYLLGGLCLYLDRAITETAPADRSGFTASCGSSASSRSMPPPRSSWRKPRSMRA
ncbi:AraC family ligand binding domain-containing protein [Paenibacillus sp. P26]|nr:AraC family ligand binding domain-containing protein [Paenibacillus sp. P26]